jgi:hypothetical protein
MATYEEKEHVFRAIEQAVYWASEPDGHWRNDFWMG